MFLPFKGEVRRGMGEAMVTPTHKPIPTPALPSLPLKGRELREEYLC